MLGGLYVYFIHHKKKSKEMLVELQLAVLPASHKFH